MRSFLSRASLRTTACALRRRAVASAAFVPIFPVGENSFRQATAEGRFYIDKTSFIPALERTWRYNQIWRPRRFGKSLVCDMLAEYYDAANKDQEMIFKNTDIMKHKLATGEMGKYLVLHLKFSSVSPFGDVRAAFHEYINTSVQQFSNKYVQAGLLYTPVEIDASNALNSLRHLFSAVRLSQHRIYLIVDDADAFITPLLFTIDTHNQSDLGYAQYRQVVGEKYTLLQNWGNVIREGTGGLTIARAFFTGTLPVHFGDDLSNMHMVKYLTFYPQFEALFGFTSEDVRRGLQTAQPALTQAQQREHLERMQRYYGGYRFHRQQKKAVFDPQSVLYYLGHLAQTAQPPSDPVDPALLRDNHEAAQFLINNHATDGPYTLQTFVLGHAPAKEMGTLKYMVEPSFRTSDLFNYQLWKYKALISFAYYEGFLTHSYDENQYDATFSANLSTQTLLLRTLFSALPSAQLAQLEAWLRSSVKPDVTEFERMVKLAMEEGSKATGRDLVSELGPKLSQVTGRVYM